MFQRGSVVSKRVVVKLSFDNSVPSTGQSLQSDIFVMTIFTGLDSNQKLVYKYLASETLLKSCCILMKCLMSFRKPPRLTPTVKSHMKFTGNLKFVRLLR